MSPGWLAWAWESASPSLRSVARQMKDKRAANALVYESFMSVGRRSSIGTHALLDWASALLPVEPKAPNDRCYEG